MDTAAIISVLISGSLLVVTTAYAWHTRVLVRTEARMLGLSSYARAIDMLMSMKESFAAEGAFFEEQMRRAGAAPAMAGLPPGQFLLIAASMWRLSYVHSVANGSGASLTSDERSGLNREIDLWLEHLPAFYDVFKVHTNQFAAHNPAFLAYLNTLYAERLREDDPTPAASPG